MVWPEFSLLFERGRLAKVGNSKAAPTGCLESPKFHEVADRERDLAPKIGVPKHDMFNSGALCEATEIYRVESAGTRRNPSFY